MVLVDAVSVCHNAPFPCFGVELVRSRTRLFSAALGPVLLCATMLNKEVFDEFYPQPT